METSLHRMLKTHFAAPGAKYEAKLGAYRIDVLNPNELVEIQHGSLAAIRKKIAHLVREHAVCVVKPIILRKTIVRLQEQAGREISRRLSPKRGQVLDIFEELVYFRELFPHPQLRIEIALVDAEETRYPGHGRRRRWRENDFVVDDERLTCVHDFLSLRSPRDLVELLPRALPRPWHTGELAEQAKIRRWLAQRIAYCLRHMQAAREVGKRGNAKLYDFASARAA